MEKIRILCYGDSNTWGQEPGLSGARYSTDIRYTALLQQKLGDDYKVIDEGLCSRTLLAPNTKYPKGDRCGLNLFAPIVYSHNPLDYVVIYLGSNDMKTEYNLKVKDIAQLLEEKYINFLKNDLGPVLLKQPKIIIVAPSIIYDDRWIGDNIFLGAQEKSYAFNETYRQVAEKTGCIFISNENIISGSDGIHLSPESHSALAEKLYQAIINDNK